MTKQNESQFITRRLVQTYGLWFRVSKRIATPDFWVYMLDRKSHQKTTDLHAITDSLADDIYSFRNDGKPVQVTAITQPTHIQVSRSDRQVLPWAANCAKPVPFVATLGAYWDGPKPTKLQIDFVCDDHAVGAFFGSQGSGKSTLLHIALLGLCRNTPPSHVEAYCIDLKKGAFGMYSQLPQVRFSARNETDALDLIRWIESLCYADTAPNDNKIRVLFIDELQILVADSQHAAEFLDLITTIAQLGREFGIRILSATQNPNADNYPPCLKPLTHFMAAGRTRVDGYLRSQLKIEGARDLMGKGDFIFDSVNGTHRFKSFWLDDQARDSELKSLLKKWGADDSLIRFAPVAPVDAVPPVQAVEVVEDVDAETVPAEAAETVEQAAPVDAVDVVEQIADTVENVITAPAKKLSKSEKKLQADVLAITPLMPTAYDFENGEIRIGHGVDLIAAIYGEPKSNAGNYKKRMIAAVDAYLATQIVQPNRTNEPNERTNEPNQNVWIMP